MSLAKNFLIRCKCGWQEFSTGISKDLSHLQEIITCDKCGKPRTFRCPKCKEKCKMLRLKTN